MDGHFEIIVLYFFVTIVFVAVKTSMSNSVTIF